MRPSSNLTGQTLYHSVLRGVVCESNLCYLGGFLLSSLKVFLHVGLPCAGCAALWCRQVQAHCLFWHAKLGRWLWVEGNKGKPGEDVGQPEILTGETRVSHASLKDVITR